MELVLKIGDIIDFFACDAKEVVLKLQEGGFLLKQKRCPKKCCRRPCGIVATKGMKGGHAFRCKKCRGSSYSMMTGTFFQSLRIQFVDIFSGMWLWANLLPPSEAAEVLGISSKSMLQMYRYFNDICSWKLLQSPELLLGGEGEIVQIDKSVVTKKELVLGIYEVSSKKGVIVPVPDCSKETFTDIIVKLVRPGTEIWTKELKSFKQLCRYGFSHKTVNRNEDFKHPVKEVCTKQVEAYLSRMKRFCRTFGGLSIRSTLLAEHLDHFLWHEEFGCRGVDTFRSLLCHIKEKYPV